MSYESEFLLEFGRQCSIAFESELVDPALEGFGYDFADTVSAYMTALSELNNQIPRIIAKGDVKQLQETCNRAIQLCTKFKNELKQLPSDKFASIRNMMPCFKSLVAIMSIVMTLGGAKKIKNMPQLAPIVSKLATVEKLPPAIKTLIFGRLPALRKIVVKDEPTGKLGKLFNVTTDAGNVIRNATKIVNNIKEVMNDSKYAKMLAEDDKNDPNLKNRKYAAMLGQINDMIAIYQNTRNSAKEIIAECNQQMTARRAEESLALFAVPFCVNMCSDGITDPITALETYCALVEDTYIECAMEAGLDITPIAQRYTVLLSEIIKEIPEALRENDTDRVVRLCKQGIHTCERCKDELRALPPDRFAKVRNFIPSYELLLSIWLIFEAGVMGAQKKMYIQSGRAIRDMGENGAFLLKLLMKAGIVKGTPADADELFAVAIDLLENSPQYGNAGTAGNVSGILAATKRGLRPFLIVIDRAHQFIKESEYAKYLEDTDYSDPNICNRKYRALIGELNQMIIMFTCIMNDVPGYLSSATETDVSGMAPENTLSVYVQKCAESNAVFVPNTNRRIYAPFLVYPVLSNGKGVIDAYIRRNGIQNVTIKQMFGIAVGVIDDFGKPVTALMAVRVGKRPIGYYNDGAKDAVQQVNISDIPGIIKHFFSKDYGLSPIERRHAIVDAAKVIDDVSKKYPRLEAGISPDAAIRNDYSDTLDEPFIFAGEKMSLYVCSIENALLQLGENPETDNDESEEALYDMAEQWLFEIEENFNKTKSGKLFKIYTWWDHTDLHIDLCVRFTKGAECWFA